MIVFIACLTIENLSDKNFRNQQFDYYTTELIRLKANIGVNCGFQIRKYL